MGENSGDERGEKGARGVRIPTAMRYIFRLKVCISKFYQFYIKLGVRNFLLSTRPS
jgi:hypothetical protein